MQLQTLKKMVGNPSNEDDVLRFCLDTASDIITRIRRTDSVEKQHYNTQIAIAIELYNKLGAEGQTSHSEGGISRSYERADVSQSLLSRITPVAWTLSDEIRVIDNENP